MGSKVSAFLLPWVSVTWVCGTGLHWPCGQMADPTQLQMEKSRNRERKQSRCSWHLAHDNCISARWPFWSLEFALHFQGGLEVPEDWHPLEGYLNKWWMGVGVSFISTPPLEGITPRCIVYTRCPKWNWGPSAHRDDFLDNTLLVTVFSSVPHFPTSLSWTLESPSQRNYFRSYPCFRVCFSGNLNQDKKDDWFHL